MDFLKISLQHGALGVKFGKNLPQQLFSFLFDRQFIASNLFFCAIITPSTHLCQMSFEEKSFRIFRGKCSRDQKI